MRNKIALTILTIELAVLAVWFSVYTYNYYESSFDHYLRFLS